MKFKLFCLIFVLFIGCDVFASAIVSQYGKTTKSAIQGSNMNEQTWNNETINNIKKQIEQNPDNINLYIYLVNTYIQSKQYDNAYEELIYLLNLSKQNKLNENDAYYIKMLYDTYKKNARYQRIRYPLYPHLAIMALIVDDKDGVELYLKNAAEYTDNVKLVINTIDTICNSTENVTIAIELCDKILEKNPYNVEIRELKAKYLTQNKNIDLAIEEYSKILGVSPNNTKSKYEMFKLLTAQNVTEKNIIKKIYKTNNPNYEVAYKEFADFLLKNNELAQAERFAIALVNEFPNNPYGYINLAEIYMKEGKLKESYEVLVQARDKADNNELISKYNVLLAKLSDEPVKEANSLIQNGLYQQALDVLDSASQENLHVILTQSQAYYLLNSKQKALELLNKSMTLYPKNSQVYSAFAYFYNNENDLDSAQKYVEQALKINPNNYIASSIQDSINNKKSKLLTKDIITSFESQNYNEAMRLIEDALKINKKDSTLYYYKALTNLAQNNYAASTASLYKCIELDKSNVLAYFYLAFAFDNLSEPKNALYYYQKFVELLPADEYGESDKLDYAKKRIEKLKS